MLKVLEDVDSINNKLLGTKYYVSVIIDKYVPISVNIEDYNEEYLDIPVLLLEFIRKLKIEYNMGVHYIYKSVHLHVEDSVKNVVFNTKVLNGLVDSVTVNITTWSISNILKYKFMYNIELITSKLFNKGNLVEESILRLNSLALIYCELKFYTNHELIDKYRIICENREAA